MPAMRYGHNDDGGSEMSTSDEGREHRYDDRYDDRGADGATRLDSTPAAERGYGEDNARDRFGGLNIGAAFFGWLVAVAISILLTSIVGAAVAAVGSSTNVTQSQAQRDAGTIGLVSALVLVVVLMVGYYTGGYVGGRVLRFDGGRQGPGGWLIRLFVPLLPIRFGAGFGAEDNIPDPGPFP